MTTPTASGKTLAFTLPVLEALALDGGATALYLYPTKALANDQLRVLQAAEAASGLSVNPAVYDGDTPASRRPGLRQRSRIVLEPVRASIRCSPGTRSGTGSSLASGSWS